MIALVRRVPSHAAAAVLSVCVLATGCHRSTDTAAGCDGNGDANAPCAAGDAAGAAPRAHPTQVQRFGGHLCLAADADGGVGLAFYDAGAHALVGAHLRPGELPRYVRLDGGEQRGARGTWTACAFTPGGEFIVVYDEVESGRVYAATASAAWDEVSVRLVDGDVHARRKAMAVGPQGKVAATWYDADRGVLRLGIYSEGTWSVTDVPWNGGPACAGNADTGTGEEHEPDSGTCNPDYGAFSDLVWRGNEIDVAMYDATFGNLVLARRTGGTWMASILDGFDVTTGHDTGDAGRWVDLAADTGGNLALVYQVGPWGALRYLASQGGTLKVEYVDTGVRTDEVTGAAWQGVVGAFASLLVGLPEGPTVYYYDGTAAVVRRAVRANDAWSEPRPVPQDGPGGLWSRAVVLADGTVARGYEWWETDETSGALVRRLGLAFESARQTR